VLVALKCWISVFETELIEAEVLSLLLSPAEAVTTIVSSVSASVSGLAAAGVAAVCASAGAAAAKTAMAANDAQLCKMAFFIDPLQRMALAVYKSSLEMADITIDCNSLFQSIVIACFCHSHALITPCGQ
jgi:hypothetical protein